MDEWDANREIGSKVTRTMQYKKMDELINMDWYEKIDLKQVIRFILEKRKELLMCGIPAIIGILSMSFALVKVETENNNMCLAVQKWYVQLPEEHWIKSEDNKYSEQYFFDLMNLHEQLKNNSYKLFKIDKIAMSQEGMAGSFFVKAMELVDARNENKYCLKNSEKETIKNNLKHKVGEDFTVFFYYDEIEMLLDFSEEDYITEISHSKSNSLSLANHIVFSYSDNPEIATIYNGHIKGVSKGKTTIHFVCNGYFFSYKIKVK